MTNILSCMQEYTLQGFSYLSEVGGQEPGGENGIQTIKNWEK